MRSPTPELRELLDDLRAVEQIGPSHVDHAWRRFSGRQKARRRRKVGLWVGGILAAAALLLAVPSIRVLTLAANADAPRSEAILQAESPDEHDTAAQRQRPTSARKDRSAPAHQPKPQPSTPETENPAAAVSPPPTAVDTKSRTSAKGRGTDSTDPVEAPTDEPSVPDSSAPSLAEELRLLDDADKAFRARDFDTVERLLRSHKEQFADGVMSKERDTLARRLADHRARDSQHSSQ